MKKNSHSKYAAINEKIRFDCAIIRSQYAARARTIRLAGKSFDAWKYPGS